MKRFIIKPFFLVGIIILTMFSCLYETDKLSTNVSLDWELALPLAKGRLTMGALLPPKGDTIQHYDEAGDGDSIIRLIYRHDSAIYINELMKLPKMEMYEMSYGIDENILGTIEVSDSIKFETIIEDGYAGSDSIELFGYVESQRIQLPRSYFGTKAVKGEYSLGVINGVEIEYVEIKDGMLTLTVTNHYAVPISFDVELLTIKGRGAPFTHFKSYSYSRIQPGETVVVVDRNLDGLVISKIVQYQITNIILYHGFGSSPMQLDDLMQLSIDFQDLTISSGEAYFYEMLLDVDTLHYFTVIEENENKKLTEISIESGFIDYRLQSDYSTGISMSLSLPSTKNEYGEEASFSHEIGSNSSVQDKWDLGGYVMDLTQNPEQPYNSIPAYLKVTLNTEPNRPLAFSTSDSIKVVLDNADSLKYEYVKGYWGKDTVVIDEETRSFDLGNLLGGWQSGNIIFTQPRVAINYDNPSGISGLFDFKMTGKKYKDKVLDKEVTINRQYQIERINQVGDPSAKGVLEIGAEEINPMMSLLPDEISYSGVLYVNHGASEGELNFLYLNSAPSLSLDVELPLKIKINDFVLKQEFAFGMNSEEGDYSYDNMRNMKIYFKVKNQFPIDLKISAVLLDTTLTEAHQVLGTLIENTLIQSPKVEQNGKVPRDRYEEYVEIIELDEKSEIIDKILQANKIEVTATLATPKDNKSVTFYTYYGIQFNIAVDAKLNVKNR
jgi:hypothetical protein